MTSTSIRSAGFTLVEVLVGLALLGFILVMLFSGLHTTSRTWEAGNRQVDANEDHRVALSFIRKQISQAVPLLYVETDSNHMIFHGGSESLQFVSRLPSHRGSTELYLVSLALAESGQGQSELSFAYRPLMPETNIYAVDARTVSQALISNVAAVTFSYFGSPLPTDPAAWHNVWDNQKVMPDLIHLRIESDLPENDWPELFVRIPAQMTPAQSQMILARTGGR